jgi:hypothetical protein
MIRFGKLCARLRTVVSAAAIPLTLAACGLDGSGTDDPSADQVDAVRSSSQRNLLEFVDAIKFESVSDTLDISYSIGGGCAEHKTEIDVELAAGGLAVLRVYDVSPPDFCEAMMYLDKRVNLRDLMIRAARKARLPGPDSIEYAVELPRVLITSDGTGGQSDRLGGALSGPRSPVAAVDKLAYDHEGLSIAYEVSSGCGMGHKPALETSASAAPSTHDPDYIIGTAAMKLVDVATDDIPPNCSSTVEGKFGANDLQKAFTERFTAVGVTSPDGFKEIPLPKVRVVKR